MMELVTLLGAVKVNANFTEVYDTLGDSGVIGNAELSQVSCTGIITASSFVGNLNANSLNQGTIPMVDSLQQFLVT